MRTAHRKRAAVKINPVLKEAQDKALSLPGGKTIAARLSAIPDFRDWLDATRAIYAAYPPPPARGIGLGAIFDLAWRPHLPPGMFERETSDEGRGIYMLASTITCLADYKAYCDHLISVANTIAATLPKNHLPAAAAHMFACLLETRLKAQP